MLAFRSREAATRNTTFAAEEARKQEHVDWIGAAHRRRGPGGAAQRRKDYFLLAYCPRVFVTAPARDTHDLGVFDLGRLDFLPQEYRPFWSVQFSCSESPLPVG